MICSAAGTSQQFASQLPSHDPVVGLCARRLFTSRAPFDAGSGCHNIWFSQREHTFTYWIKPLIHASHVSCQHTPTHVVGMLFSTLRQRDWYAKGNQPMGPCSVGDPVATSCLTIHYRFLRCFQVRLTADVQEFPELLPN